MAPTIPDAERQHVPHTPHRQRMLNREIPETPPTRSTLCEVDNSSAAVSPSSPLQELDRVRTDMVDAKPKVPQNSPNMGDAERISRGLELVVRGNNNARDRSAGPALTGPRQSHSDHTSHLPARVSLQSHARRRSAIGRSFMGEEEELTELEELMVPTAVRQGFRDGGAFPIDPRSPLSDCRVSKFTTGLISTLGYIPIENKAWEMASEDHPANHNNMEVPCVVGDGEFVGYDGLPAELAKMESREKLDMTKAELDSVLEELAEVDETPLIDPKYFDVGSYLNHVQTADERQAQIHALQFFAHLDAIGDLDEISSGSDAGAVNSVPPTIRTDRPRKKIVHDHGAAIGDTVTMIQPDMSHESDIGRGGNKSNLLMLMQDSKSQRSRSPSGLTMKTDETNVEAGAQTLGPGFARDQKAIDWDNKKNIEEVFRSRGFIIVKSSDCWLPIETSWLLLFHKKVKGVIEAGHLVKLPGLAFVVDEFNDFFEGKILQDAAGADLPAREPRDEMSLKAELAQNSSGIKPMRHTVRKLLEGQSGGMVYVPQITEQELDRYLQDKRC
ncbi:hypothetical protein BKA63DRAFT_584051 [Paraphoma chrysanthemicola]|nr:hypothetical protein BKA63DRAFT_584051 [Paraphoma chrysanthemicola]